MTKVSNKQISKIISEIADILQMQPNPEIFKIRAYQRAAREIEEYPESLSNIKDIEKIKKIPGIGQSIAEKIIEIAETGTCEYYEQLKNTIPVNITELNRIEGIGPKKIKRFYDELGIKSLFDLEKALKEKRIRNLRGFTAKSEEKILKAIQKSREHADRFRLDEALFYAQRIVDEMKKHFATIKIEIAGSIRRRKETIGDADILLVSKDAKSSMEKFTSLPNIDHVIAKGETKSTIEFDNGFQADLRIVELKSFGAALQYFTGNKAHNIKIRKIASNMGYKLNEYGLFKGQKFVAGKTEEEIYKILGMQTPPPEIREDEGEIEIAKKYKLPKLISLSDIKGDLQMHTSYSDGINTPEEMAKEAKILEYEYIAITEHNTKGLEVAGGIDEDDIPKYISMIRSLKSKVPILAGLEVNIAKDGSLTVQDKFLKLLDFVICGIHSHFKQSKEDMTKRILKAFDNPHIHAFAHPTGRLLMRRMPYEIDFTEICKKAARNNICMEINAHPERLDLDGEHIKVAKSLGCKFSIGTDSHNTTQLKNMKFGVYMARRGWLEKEDIINTLSYKDLLKYLRKWH